MAIGGLIILDSSGHSIVQSGFRSNSPAYPLLHIEAINDALSKGSPGSEVDSVLFVPSMEHEIPSACCHIRRGDLRFLCPVTGDDPLYAISFLNTFADILVDYFGQISAETLREHFDVVYQLLEEILDAGGHPSTTQPNALRDIVLPPSLLSKVLSVAGVSPLTGQGSLHSQPFASPIPWRKTTVRYNNNEIFFDVAETMRAIINKNGIPVSTTIWGRVDSNCKLSGTPDLLLSFSNAQSLSDCSFHPCVRIQRWVRERQLSFVPPDGHFTLMEYRHAPNISHPVAVPFQLKVEAKFDKHNCALDVTFASKLATRNLDNVLVQMYLGEGVTGANMTATNNSSWVFESATLTLQWHIKSAPPSSTFTMKGNFYSQKYVRPSRALRIKFEISQHTFSALKVDQLKMTGESYKPYKGVRGRSTGDVEWRW